MVQDVLDFVTYKERLKYAEASMMLAYMDFTENNGSDDRDWYWQNFETKRNEYRAIRDEVPQDVQ
jgi:hypothetical protein